MEGPPRIAPVPRVASIRARVLTLGVLLLLTVGVAGAISLYDIVQLSRAGKSDREIIELVEVTQARFALDAQAVADLKKAGVSETVIQALIDAGPPEEEHKGTPSAENLPEAPPDSRRPTRRGTSSDDHATHDSERSAHGGASPPARSGGGRASGGGVFGFFPFEEAGSGSHGHFAVTVSGIPVLVLRSEANHRSIAERAEATIARLGSVSKSTGGRFFAVSGRRPGVAYESRSGSELEVLEVSRGDVVAYQRRSLGEVSAQRLAAYWAALLNDYTRLLAGEEPAELGTLHVGESLERLRRKLADGASGKAASNPGETLSEAVDRLSAEDKDNLIELATRVPTQFRAPKGGSP